MKISIIIPVYQTEQYLKRCLDSVVNQSLKDIEIIVVNDASPDNSQAIIDEYAKKDSRIKSLVHQENQGLLSARNSGVKAATGEYILFLDSDDELVLDACERVCQVLRKRPVDILRFGCEAMDTTSFLHKQEIEAYFLPYHGNLKGSKIFGMFLDRLFSTQVSCFRRCLWEGLDKLTDITFMISCEDMYAALYVASRARSYSSITDKLYRYYFGVGISTDPSSTTKVTASLDRWNRFLGFKAIHAVRNLLEKNNVFSQYEKQYESLVDYRIGREIRGWHQGVDPAIKQEAWKNLCDGWRSFEVLLRVIQLSQSNPEIVETVLNNWALRKQRKIKHIGIVSAEEDDLLFKDCQIWESLGYRVTLLSDENVYSTQRNNTDAGLLMLDGRSVEAYAPHAKRLQEDLADKKIDLIVLSSQENFFLWDICVGKDQGIPGLVYFAGKIETLLQRAMLSVADGVVVRSLADFVFCQSLGASVVLLETSDQRWKEVFESLGSGERVEKELTKEDFSEENKVLLTRLSDQILATRQQAEIYRARIVEIEASKSWRMTKPLRDLKKYGIKESMRRMLKHD